MFYMSTKKIDKCAAMLYIQENILTGKQLLTTYNIYVRLVFKYGALLYGTADNTVNEDLEKNKRLLRRLCVSF